MHPEVDELRPKLKEILYDCAVEIRATKAALYLFDGERRFELIIEYGFRETARPSADRNDPLVDRCGRGRTPFFINGVGTEPRFSQLMFDASTDRLLAAPLYWRGKYVGFIDMRDKAAKAPFEQPDIAKAQRIADRMVELFANPNVFGQRFITLSELGEDTDAKGPSQPSAPAVSATPPMPPQQQPQVARPAPAPPPPAPIAAPELAPPPKPQRRATVPGLATLVIDARSAASRIVVAPPPESIGENEVNAARDVLRSVLLIPGTAAAMFSAYGHLGGVQEIASRSTLTEDARNLLQSKLNVWLTKRGEAGGYVRTSFSTPLGTSAPPVGPTDLQKVFTAPLVVGSLKGLYLTAAFSSNPDRVAHELLATLHSYLQVVIEQSMQRGAVSQLRARIAEKLLEPEFTKYPELRRHSEQTAKLAELFARFLQLPQNEVEAVRIVALVHDAGMRLLDYERLYRKKDLSAEELGFLREHPAVGAAMIEPLLGNEIARAVLCHHERVDGRGYPHELHGDEIPLASRIVQICDAFIVMTDPESYQANEPVPAALATIARSAGGQFDAELANKFVEFVRAGIPS
jgi:HD domain